jgi:ubiquinone biosynthesis protein UbiJ
MVLESPLAVALNHLLEAEAWARERLVRFAGEALELRAAPLPALRFTVTARGLLEPAPPGVQPSLVLSLGPATLAAVARGEEHFLRAAELEGDARFAAEVLHLVRHLRWDFEEDLARLVGDVAAHRMADLMRRAADASLDAGRRLGQGFMEYAVEEAGLLVPRAEYEQHAAALARLRDALERLEKRIERLAAGR